MSKVCIERLKEYKPEHLQEKISTLIECLGGLERFVKPGETVLIKPNCLSNTDPEKGIITHPEFVAAVIRIVKKNASRIWVGDSPGFGSFSAACARNGLKKLAESEGAEIIDFKADSQVSLSEKLAYGSFEVDSRLVNADKIINLPKLKTHMLMHMTLCVKNMYGIIPGLKKLEFHAKVQRDREMFAKVLLDIFSIKPPVLNIIDGIVGLEGNGPGTDGIPVNSGIIVASDDAFAADHLIPKLVGIDPYSIYTNEAYRKYRLNGKEISYETVGFFETGIKFKEPPRESSSKGAFSNLIKIVRSNMTPVPKFIAKKCTGCKVCVNHCPVKALSYTGKKSGIKCDYEKCISCFCCHEMCPDAAIDIKRPFLSFLLR